MRFFSRQRRRPYGCPSTSSSSHPSQSQHTLYHQCVVAAGRDHAMRLAELAAMQASLDLLQPWLPLLAERGVLLQPHAMRWRDHERAVVIDLTRVLCDAMDNQKLIDTLLDAGFDLVGRTDYGPLYSVHVRRGALVICVQGLGYDLAVDEYKTGALLA